MRRSRAGAQHDRDADHRAARDAWRLRRRGRSAQHGKPLPSARRTTSTETFALPRSHARHGADVRRRSAEDERPRRGACRAGREANWAAGADAAARAGGRRGKDGIDTPTRRGAATAQAAAVGVVATGHAGFGAVRQRPDRDSQPARRPPRRRREPRRADRQRCESDRQAGPRQLHGRDARRGHDDAQRAADRGSCSRSSARRSVRRRTVDRDVGPGCIAEEELRPDAGPDGRRRAAPVVPAR